MPKKPKKAVKTKAVRKGLMSMFAPTMEGHSPLFIDEFGQAKKKHKKAMAEVLLQGKAEVDNALEYRRRYAAGSFGCHEAMDRASLLAMLVQDWLCEHPSVKANTKWAELARRAESALSTLYTEIGVKHL